MPGRLLYRRLTPWLLAALLACALMTASAPADIGGDGAELAEERDNKLCYTISYENGDEAVVGENIDSSIRRGRDMAEWLDELREFADFNTVIDIKTVEPAGITQLTVDADICGIVVGSSDSDKFEISYIGVGDVSDFPVNVITNDGKLTVYVRGNKQTAHFISTVPQSRSNVIRILAPSDSRITANIANDCGLVYIEGAGKRMEASTVNGAIRVQGALLEADSRLKSANGDIFVIQDSITGKLEASSINGNVDVRSDKIYSNVNMSAINGGLKIEAGFLKSAALTAVNGDVTAVVGRLGGGLSAEVVSGDIMVSFKSAPEDLSLQLDAKRGSNIVLPKGWDNSYVSGNGIPELRLKVGGGSAYVEIAEE